MLSTVQPLLRVFPSASWLTVGDGLYGSDAFYLQTYGADCTATSLTDTTLRIAHENGFIKKYRVENAESLSFPDEAFEFVLCKESYHHFPRPPVAFYEMWRVAKTAIILIEPFDGQKRLLAFLKEAIKRVLRGDQTSQFEPSGNFLFRVSVREIEKMATALNGACVAVRHFNDFYYPPAATANSDEISPGNLITRAGLAVQNVLCRLRLLNFGLATIVVFKQEVSSALLEVLARDGFKTTALPKNPYL